jgi:hypothetical protein
MAVLEDALLSPIISSAGGLDVFEQEPCGHHQLLRLTDAS